MKLFRSRTSSSVTEAPAVTQGDGASGHLLPGPGHAPAEEMTEMSFLDHLEELRWRILKGLAGILVATIACSFFSGWIIDQLLLGPTYSDFFMYRFFGVDAETIDLQNRTITGQFFAYWGTVLMVGLIAGSPIIVYQIWKFLEPGLYPSERKGLRFASAFATLFFMAGIAFGYLIITPLALQFFQTFQISERIVNEFDITKYFSMVVTWSFGAGILFELPVVIFFLAKLGIVSAAAMRKARKYGLIAILIVAAFLTPPDPISQVLVAIPLLLLYELSIYITSVIERNREEDLRKALE